MTDTKATRLLTQRQIRNRAGRRGAGVRPGVKQRGAEHVPQPKPQGRIVDRTLDAVIEQADRGRKPVSHFSLLGHSADPRVIASVLVARVAGRRPPLGQRHEAGIDQFQVAKVAEDLLVAAPDPGAEQLPQ